jgi:predicted HTH transcriptional regulator
MKDLSGMANGGGGVLIFGVAEDPENREHRPPSKL